MTSYADPAREGAPEGEIMQEPALESEAAAETLHTKLESPLPREGAFITSPGFTTSLPALSSGRGSAPPLAAVTVPADMLSSDWETAPSPTAVSADGPEGSAEATVSTACSVPVITLVGHLEELPVEPPVEPPVKPSAAEFSTEKEHLLAVSELLDATVCDAASVQLTGHVSADEGIPGDTTNGTRTDPGPPAINPANHLLSSESLTAEAKIPPVVGQEGLGFPLQGLYCSGDALSYSDTDADADNPADATADTDAATAADATADTDAAADAATDATADAAAAATAAADEAADEDNADTVTATPAAAAAVVTAAEADTITDADTATVTTADAAADADIIADADADADPNAAAAAAAATVTVADADHPPRSPSPQTASVPEASPGSVSPPLIPACSAILAVSQPDELPGVPDSTCSTGIVQQGSMVECKESVALGGAIMESPFDLEATALPVMTGEQPVGVALLAEADDMRSDPADDVPDHTAGPVLLSDDLQQCESPEQLLGVIVAQQESEQLAASEQASVPVTEQRPLVPPQNAPATQPPGARSLVELGAQLLFKKKLCLSDTRRTLMVPRVSSEPKPLSLVILTIADRSGGAVFVCSFRAPSSRQSV